MRKSYKTVLNEASAEIEEKRSRFIAAVKPVTSEEEALEFINGVRSKHWNATHNVYAYYIGGDVMAQRFSDDGEPSGTAGMPVLEVIKRMEVQDLVVVVTRYFGGTLLGAAGLIRAYSRSAALGIEAAGIVNRLLCVKITVVIEYALFGKVQNLIVNEGYPIKDVIYGQDVEVVVYVQEDETERFLKLIEEATNGRSVVEIGEKTYITVDMKGKIIN